MSQALNEEVRFKEVSVRDTEQTMKETQMVTKARMELLVEIYEMIRRHEFDLVTRHLEEVLGKKASHG